MRLEDLPDETCPGCGANFEPHWPTQKYCTPRCRGIHNSRFGNAVRAEELRRARAGLRCQRCDVPIEAKASHKKFCSRRCFDAARRYPTWFPREACAHCGGPMDGTRRRDALYCGKTCQSHAAYARRLAEHAVQDGMAAPGRPDLAGSGGTSPDESGGKS